MPAVPFAGTRNCRRSSARSATWITTRPKKTCRRVWEFATGTVRPARNRRTSSITATMAVRRPLPSTPPLRGVRRNRWEGVVSLTGLTSLWPSRTRRDVTREWCRTGSGDVGVDLIGLVFDSAIPGVVPVTVDGVGT